MVETMRYINIMGPINDFDRMVANYIAKYDIHLEYAAKEISHDAELIPFTGVNPLSASYQKAQKFIKLFGSDNSKNVMSEEKALEILDEAEAVFNNRSSQIKEFEDRREAVVDKITKIEPFTELNVKIGELNNFRMFEYRFGKMLIGNYMQYKAFMFDTPEVLFVGGKRDNEYIWGCYFYPLEFKPKVDSLFSSFHFERIEIVDSFTEEGLTETPSEAYTILKAELESLDFKIKRLNEDIKFTDEINVDSLKTACKVICELYKIYDIKKYAIHTRKDFYILVGWMVERDAVRLGKELEKDQNVMFITNSDIHPAASSPPTKLKNPPLINFFEFFVNMYGPPSYGEIDPTPFLAITYTLLFGIMFGDLGQGAVISLVGFALYKFKGFKLGAILGVVGLSSMGFGVIFGSCFGFEDVVTPLWTHPNSDINTMLIMAVALGAILILTSMVVNIFNLIRNKNWIKLYFSFNGLSGLVFYGVALYIAYSMLNEHLSINKIEIILLVASILCIAFGEPVYNLIHKKKSSNIHSLPMFLFETFIEVFEIILTFFTNTLSFVRVGAFALSHAGMMGVVLLLSETATGSHNLVVLILGNILVICLEGLVVGIQVLRLEFYEIFSRFYEGNGRVFQSHKRVS